VRRLLPALLAGIVLQAGLPAQESRPASQPDSGSPARPEPRRGDDAVSVNAEALKLVEARKFDEALAMIEKAQKLAPADDVIARNAARILTRRAQARFEAGELDAAEADLRRALEIAPKESLSRVQLAIVFRARGEPDRARREVERVLQDEPGSGAAHEELAHIFYEEEDLQGAADEMEKAIKLEPARLASLQAFKDKLDREIKVEALWPKVEREPFVVKYDDQKFSQVGQVVLGFLQAAESVARRTLGHVPARRVTLIMYGQQDFAATTGAHSWAGGLFDGKIRLPVRNFEHNKEAIRKTIAHEYTHLVVRDLCRKCPVWLNEGLAQLAEEKSLSQARETLRAMKEPRHISEMPASWMGIQDARLVSELYAQALLFTHFLVERLGYPAIRDLLAKTNTAPSFDAAFAEIAGKSLDEAEAEWRGPR
jgi:tetratricopeptide (TPR) repeat protein